MSTGPCWAQTVVSEPLAVFGLGQFNTADYSPDGQYIVSGGSAGVAAVWDADTGAYLRGFPVCNDYILSVAVSPDSTRLATSPWFYDTGVEIRNIETGELLVTLPTQNKRSLEFTPDGSQLVAAGGDVTVWDVKTGQLLQTLASPGISVYRAALSPDGTRIATADQDGSVRIWDMATSQVVQTLAGHTGVVTSVDFSHDGARLLSSSLDGTAKVWDLATSRVLQTFSQEGVISQASLSPDGTRVVTGSYDGTARVWDVETGALVFDLAGHRKAVLAARFSPDGTRILTGSADNTVRIWDAETGALLRIDRGYENAPNAAAFVPGSTRILAGSALWNTADGRFLRMFVEDSEEVRGAAVSRDGTRVATGAADGTVRLWDTDSGQLLDTEAAHTRQVTDLDFSPDGTQLVTASDDMTAKVWDLDSGTLLTTFADHGCSVTQVAWSPDGSRVCSGDVNGGVFMWNPETGNTFYQSSGSLGYGSPVDSIDFSPDARLVVVKAGSQVYLLGAWSGVGGWASSSRYMSSGYPALFVPDGTHMLAMNDTTNTYDFGISNYVSDKYQNVEEVLFEKQGSRIFLPEFHPPAAFSADSSRVLTGYSNGRVLLWDSHLTPAPAVTPYPTPTPSPTPVATPPLPPPEVVTKPVQFYGLGSASAAVLSGDGKTLVTGGSAGAFEWDVASGLRIRDLYGPSGGVSALALSPDISQVATGTADQSATVRVWGVLSGELVRRYGGGTLFATAQAYAVAYSHDGRYILGGLNNNLLALWDVDTTSALRVFSGHTSTIVSDAYSPDDSQIASGSLDGTARIWDPATGDLLKTFDGGKGSVYSVAFSPDGSKLLTACNDNAAQLWDIASSRTLLTFEGHTDAVRGAVFSPDGTRVLTWSSDKTAKEWDSATGQLLRTYNADPETVLEAGYRGDGAPYVLTSAGYVEDLTLRDFHTGQSIQTFQGHLVGAVFDADVSPDGSRIASTLSVRGNAGLEWDTATGERLQSLIDPPVSLDAIAYSPDGTQLLTGSMYGNASLWDASTGELLKTFQSGGAQIFVVDFSPDGSIALIGNALWNIATGEIVRTLPTFYTGASTGGFSPDGSSVLMNSTLFDFRTALPFAALDFYVNGLISSAFSPDGTLVAVGGSIGSGGQVQVWDPFRNQVVRTFVFPNTGDLIQTVVVAFSPDGKRLLASAGTLRPRAYLWDLATGQLLRTFSGFSGTIYSIDFTPDGRYAVIGCGDGTVTLWDADTFVPSTTGFDFADSQEGWSSVSSDRFDPPTAEWQPGAGGGLILRAPNNTSTFGYWESAPVSLWDDMAVTPASSKPAAVAAPIQSVYTADFQVRSSAADRSRVPQLRLRVNEENLQQSHFLAVESRADGIASPDADGESYSVVFSPAPGSSEARIAFDLLNFDAADDPTGDLELTGVTITRRDPMDLTDRQLVRQYTFDDGAEGWVQRTSPEFDAPEFGIEPGALTVTGTGSANAFGFWSSPIGDIPAATGALSGDVLYVATFTVESDVAAADRATVPQFRVRLNEDSFHAALVVAVESKGDADRSPVAGEPQQYVVYYRPPAGVEGQGLVASFDYLNFDPAADATATLKLHDVTVEAVPYPW